MELSPTNRNICSYVLSETLPTCFSYRRVAIGVPRNSEMANHGPARLQWLMPRELVKYNSGCVYESVSRDFLMGECGKRCRIIQTYKLDSSWTGVFSVSASTYYPHTDPTLHLPQALNKDSHQQLSGDLDLQPQMCLYYLVPLFWGCQLLGLHGSLEPSLNCGLAFHMGSCNSEYARKGGGHKNWQW